MEGILFFFACCFFVASIVIYMRREDNDYAKLLKKFESVENSNADLETKFNTFAEGQRNICAHLGTEVGDTLSRVRKLEDRPSSMNVNFPKSIKFDPVKLLVTREAPPAAPTKTVPPMGAGKAALFPKGESLLNKAGIKTKGKREVTQ